MRYKCTKGFGFCLVLAAADGYIIYIKVMKYEVCRGVDEKTLMSRGT